MRSYHHLNMPVLRGDDHLDRRLAGLLPRHTTFVLLDVFRSDRAEEENVLALRDAAFQTPRHLQVVMPCGPVHTVLLLAATPPFARQALDYALVLAGDSNYIVVQDGQARDRHGDSVPGHDLNADSLDLWAAHIGLYLRADGMFDRSPSFVRFAASVGLP